MPITKMDEWEECKRKNADPYGGSAIKATERAMEILDEESGDFEANDIIHRANRDSEADLTYFLASCVAQMIATFHSRGEEFRTKWNLENQIRDEGERANKNGGTPNTAVLQCGE